MLRRSINCQLACLTTWNARRYQAHPTMHCDHEQIIALHHSPANAADKENSVKPPVGVIFDSRAAALALRSASMAAPFSLPARPR
jgi:hypothetical protein